MRAVAAAASSLQYCSVGSLMADVRQCCFPPGGGGEGGGVCTFYRVVEILGLCLALGSRCPSGRSDGMGGGTTFELRCLPPHDTNVDCSCGHGAGAPLAVAAGAAPDCARVDVQGNFPIKTPHRHRYRGKIGISVGCPGLLRRLPACARVVKVNSLRSGCWK